MYFYSDIATPMLRAFTVLTFPVVLKAMQLSCEDEHLETERSKGLMLSKGN